MKKRILTLALVCFGSIFYPCFPQNQSKVNLFSSRSYLSRDYKIQNFQDWMNLRPAWGNLPLTLYIYNGHHEAPSYKWFRLNIAGLTVATERNLNADGFTAMDVSGIVQGGESQINIEGAGVPGAALWFKLETNPITLTSLNPTELSGGSNLVISGNNFSSQASQVQVLLNGIPATVSATSPTSINCTVPANAQTGVNTVQVKVNDLMSNTLSISVSAQSRPSLSSTDYWMAPPGANITISGSQFGSSSQDVQVFFADKPGQVVSVTPNQIVVTVPNWPFSTSQVNIPLTVKVNGKTSSNALPFDIGPAYHGAPLLLDSD